MHSIELLLSGALDYAGLFPPAQLDMAAAVRAQAVFFEGDDAWFCGRFVLPTARFAEFEAAAKDLLPSVGHEGESAPWLISALTAPAGEEAFEADLQAVAAFNDRHEGLTGGAALIDAIEVRASTAKEIDRALSLVPQEIYPYFEFPAGTDPRGFIAALAGLDAGAKLRTGGVTAAAHPSIEEVAAFVLACAGAGVPFKATAGLHHPLRHHAPSVGCRQHGFLNLFTGAALAHLKRIDESMLRELLAEESIEAFRFTDEGFGWRDLEADLAELDAARMELVHSFGSCSCDEPLADLRALGLLRREAAKR